MPENKEIPEDDLKTIVENATIAANDVLPETSSPWRMRLLVALAVLVLVFNAIIGVYNSVVLKQEVRCNQEQAKAVAKVGDQNRNITKDAVDHLFSSPELTQYEKSIAKKKYDAQFKINTSQRQQILAGICQPGETTPSSKQS